MIPPEFPGWRCSHHEGRFCPPGGCPMSGGCLLDQGVAPVAADVSTLPPWVERLAVFLVNGVTRFFNVLTDLVRAVAEISPVAWFVIVAVVTFTAVVLLV
jgi:hypothetical protein